jgi:large subunit ribosomal protein L15
MKYNDLNITANKKSTRVGRGIAAGKGKTAGRGTKGYGARTGSKTRPGFAGGQNPLMQALPKLRGFKSHRVPHENIYTGNLDQFGNKVVNTTVLAEAGLVSSPYVSVKLLSGRGELTKKVSVKLQSASSTAIEAVEQAGGSFEKTPRLGRPVTSEKQKAKAEKKSEK